MDDKLIIENLEREWDFDTGFFGLLRQGKFDAAGLNRLVDTLSVISFLDHELINRRAVSLLWYIPLFMRWQRERVEKNGGDVAELEKATNRVQALVETILGVP
jgi:hypothetical protein